MRIEPPNNFWHAGDLSPRFASNDPRQETYTRSELDIDLRRCSFVRPSAVLWCAVYPLLATLRGTSCRFLVPKNLGTAVYLKSVGLYSTLKDGGVELDDRDVPDKPDREVVLPVTRFKDGSEVETLVNRTLDRLDDVGLGSANMRPFVADVFAELAMNAVQHSESRIDAYGLIQFYEYEQGSRFVCTVADGGIGIRHSLERNPKLRARAPYDWTAIELASRERISGGGDPTRGIGLSWISDEMRRAGRQLIVHSGLGALTINESAESEAKRVTLLPGTLAFASILT